MQYIHGLGIKTIDYVYDPITSNVTSVIYQKHITAEYFEHVYEYDTETNQLTKVSTVTNDTTPNVVHAEYTYYESGALKRIQYPNQGVDYVYNLNGQLKSINHPSLDKAKDPGGDDNDLFGITLEYYNGDYSRTNTPTPINSIASSNVDDQYNGNIKALRWQTKDLSVLNSTTDINGKYIDHNAQTFTYNDNNWLTSATFGKVNNSTATFTASPNNSYNVFGIDYDKNGNIQHLNRNMLGNNAMDALSYTYTPNTNQLSHVDDTVPTGNDVDDIKDQSAGNYVYNEIGQLERNIQEAITYEYNASGLVTTINRIVPTDTYNTVFSNDFENVDLNQLSTVWIGPSTNFNLDLYDFTILRDYNKALDYCQEYANDNKTGLWFDTSLVTYEVTRSINVDQNVAHVISLDAIVKQLPASFNNSQPITLTISILDSSGNILDQTTLNNPNSCNFYHKDNVSFNIIPPTNTVTLKINVINNLVGNAFVYIDNFKIEKQTFEEQAISFYYDDKGKRIRKEVFLDNTSTKKITYYVRDTSGSPMAIYTNTITPGLVKPSPILKEQPVYGASRLGVYYKGQSTGSWNGFVYQLTDHLGNVRATFTNENSTLAERGATDYYPFGMPMPERRNVDANGYRYAYQGQEKDPETGKEAFELRLWDGRIGRWLTTDPKGQYHSPYMAMDNNPISSIDPDGGSTDTDYVWTDANGNEQSVHVNDGINQVVRISSGLGFLANGLAKPGVSDSMNYWLNQGLMESGTIISNTSFSFNVSDLSSAQKYQKFNNSRGSSRDDCLTAVCRATSKIFAGENLNLRAAMTMNLPGNLDGNNMNKTMQHLLNIGKAGGSQLTFNKGNGGSYGNIGGQLYGRTVQNSTSVWGLSLSNTYHSLMVYVERTNSHTKYHLVDQFSFQTFSNATSFNTAVENHFHGSYNSHRTIFTQYQH